MLLNDKVVVLTGASGAIGSLIAQNLDAEGAKIILVGKNKNKLQEVNANLQNKDTHSYMECDLCSAEFINNFAANLSQTTDKVNVLIHAAGVGIYKKLADYQLADWNTSYDVNVRAPFLLTQKLLPFLLNTDNPLVVSLGSISGRIPMADRSAYNSSKFALRGWSLCMSEEFKDTKLDFTLMSLGSTMTDFGPLTINDKKELEKRGKKYLDPNFVAGKIVEIIKSDERSEEVVLLPEGVNQ